MVAITATNSATPSLQASLNGARLEQTRREADQAEANAKDLRSEADAAEDEAQKDRNKVQQLTIDSQHQDTTYAQQLRASTSAVPAQTQDFLERLYKATSQKFAASGNALKTNASAAPVLNAQGQATGRILNTQA